MPDSTKVKLVGLSWWRSLRARLRTDAAAHWLLAVILIASALLRLTHLNWDQGWHIHPDERFLTMVVSAMDLPDNPQQFFDSTRSPMNPSNLGFGFFVYGTLPLFLVRVVAEALDKFNAAFGLWEVAPGIARNLTGYDGVHLVGRALSGLFDVGAVWLTFVIARRLFGRKVGLVAAALYAFAPLALQQSHFFTVDTFATFFALLTFYFAVRVAQGGESGRQDGGWVTYLALGASLGASLACRINLAPMAAIAVLAAAIRAWDDWRAASLPARDQGPWLSTLLQATLFRLLLMTLVAIAFFRVLQPYAFGGTSLLDFTLAEQFRDSMRTIGRIIRGDADQPPMHQWANRTPFVFPWVNMVVWGMGLAAGVTAWAGWAVAAWRIVRGLTVRPDPLAVKRLLLPVAWVGGMFLYHSMQFSYTMRYYLPIYPFLTMLAAWLLWWLVDRAGLEARDREQEARSGNLLAGGSGSSIQYRASSIQHPPFHILSRAAYALMALVLVATVLWGWGFLAIYRRPLTRITASEWIYANIPEGSVIANEHWDDALPGGVPGRVGFKPVGAYYGLTNPSTRNRDGQIENYWEDVPEKRERLYQWLNEADVIVMSSNRLWGSIPRLPMRYPMTTLYYQLMAEEKLGFELAARFTSFPTIFGIQFDDTWAEEAFSVYDHPEVRIYRKTPAYSEALARSYFDAVDLENTIQMWPKQVSAAPTALYFTPQEAARQQAGGTWSAMFDLSSLVNRSQVLSVIVWLLVLQLLGLVAFPIAFVILRRLTDRGYGVSKVLALLALAWLSWIGPSLKLAPYARWWILWCLALMAVLSGALAWRHRSALAAFWRRRSALLLTEEVLFLALFGLFLVIRWGNPDLWHPARGGEKPMDFAYLNAVMKSTFFPPYDPWHAGGFLNYYYFGFVIVGTLIKLTGIVPWVAYNLAVPTLFALTGTAAFSVAFNLADGDRATEFPGEEAPYQGMRIGSLLAGLAGVFFVAIIGNLGNVKLLLDQFAARASGSVQSTIPGLAKLLSALMGMAAVLAGRATLEFPNDWWFWNASRIIPDTINEFPFFTFVYADLHAHMIALPLTLLGLAIAVSLVRLGERMPGDTNGPHTEPSPWRIPLAELVLILALAFVVGALRATNTWDFPTYLLVGMIAVAVLEASRRLAVPFPEALDERLAFLFRAAVAVLWRTVILLLVASALYYPYTANYATAYAGLQRYREATTSIPDYLTVHGFFLAVVVIYLLSELAAQRREGRVPRWMEAALPLILAAVVVLVGAGWILKARIWLVALPIAALAAVLALGRDLPPARRFGLLLIALALAITMGVEVIRQKDDIGRMNTVFKFYMQAWVLFGIAGAFGLASWVPRALNWQRGWRRLAWAVTLVLFLGVMLYPPFAARAKVRDRFSAEASPHTLDGMAYMDKGQYFDNNRDMRLADDKAAILWMLQNVSGSPVILEGVTPGYRWGNRYSIYTGLPAVQGWDWHQKQQRSVVPSTVIDRRLGHVQEIYNTLDQQRAIHLLEYYRVRYIIVGELELAYYTPEGLDKFDALADQGYLEVVYPTAAAVGSENSTVRIYRVLGRGAPAAPSSDTFIGPQPVPTPTEMPQPEEGEPVVPSAEPFLSPLQ